MNCTEYLSLITCSPTFLTCAIGAMPQASNQQYPVTTSVKKNYIQSSYGFTRYLDLGSAYLKLERGYHNQSSNRTHLLMP